MRPATVAVLLMGAAVGGGVAAWLTRAPSAASAAPAPASASAAAVRHCGPSVADTEHPGMQWIAAGEFTMGADATYPEEGPSVPATVKGFWIDQTEVTNAQFAQFVAATGYRTLAERGVRLSDAADAAVVPGSAVFRPGQGGGTTMGGVNWWQFVPGTDWRHPDGPQSSIAGREQHPVVHVAYEDAEAYARWKGRSLPTESQYEFAAQGANRRDRAGAWGANTWQGVFPSQDTAADGYGGTAPVACYGANQHGLHDMVGNVWEWTATPYYARHDAAAPVQHPRGFDPAQPEEKAVAVIKGGSFLCSPDYCMRYRPEARVGQSLGLGASHIGFRTVLNP